MQVQGVELVASHFGDESLQLVERNECTCRVNHQFAHMSAGSILDGELRNSVDTLLVARTEQNLVESHQSPEHAARSLALDVHALGIDSKSVCFVIVESRVEGEYELYATLTAVHDVANTVSEHLAGTLHFVVQHSSVTVHMCYKDVPGGMHIECLGTLLNGQSLRHWDETEHRVAHFLSHLRLGIESAPSGSLHVSLLRTLRNDELHAARLNAVE